MKNHAKGLLAAMLSLASTAAMAGPLELPETVCNASTVRIWFNRRGTQGDMAALATGRLEAGSTAFAIRDGSAASNCLMLAGWGSPVDTKAVSIPVGKDVEVFHFLQAYNPGPALVAWDKANFEAKAKGDRPLDPPTLFRYVIHYADGKEVAVNCRWDEAVNDWRRAGEWAAPAYATTAWEKMVNERTVHNPQTVGLPTRWPRRQEHLALYAFRFENPRPQVAVRTIDMVSANTTDKDWGAPALLAISTGAREYDGTTYYVALHGDDANPGTFERPWQTPYKAAEAAGPGDTVAFRGGRYLLEQDWNAVVHVQGTGVEGRPLTFMSFPGETAVIDGDQHHGAPYERTENPGPFDRDRGLLNVVGKEHVVVRNLWVESARKCGLGIFGNKNVLLHHNTVYGTWHCGMNTGGNESIDFLGNTLGQVCSYKYVFNLETQEWAPWEPDGRRDSSVPFPGDKERKLKGVRPGREGIDNHSNRHVEIAYNEIYWCNKEGIADPTEDFKIHHNHIHHLPYEPGTYWPSAIYLDAYGDGMRNIEVYDNVIHDACGGITVGCESPAPAENVHIRHNLLFNIHQQALAINSAGADGPKRDIVIEFNTIHNAGFTDFNQGPAGGVCLDSQRQERVTVRYNIIQKVRDFNIVLRPTIDRVANRIVLRENLVEQVYPSTERLGTDRWRVRMQATNGDRPLYGDAMFRDVADWDFRLQDDSPAVDATPAALDSDGSAADFGAFADLTPLPPLPAEGEGFALRLIAGSDEDYTDKQGRTWKSDRGTLRGARFGVVNRNLDRIEGTNDPFIYSTELYGARTVDFDLPPGRYIVRLHFAETWMKEPGKRVFNVYLNNRLMAEKLDVFAEAGPAAALIKEFKLAVPRGRIQLKLENITDNAIINGLEIIQVTR